MIQCRECGELTGDGTAFCTNCGVFLEWEATRVPDDAAPVAEPADEPAPRPTPVVPPGARICGGCGMPNEATRWFCAKCGFSLVGAEVVRPAPWWRRLLGRRRVHAVGTRRRPGTGRRRIRGLTSLAVVAALLAGGGILAGPRRDLVIRAYHSVENVFRKPVQVRVTGQRASGVFGRQHAGLAVDAAKNTYWAAPRTNRVPYLRVTFGAPITLARIGLTPGVSVDTPKFVTAPRPAEIEVTATTGSGPLVRRFAVTDTAGFQEFRWKVEDVRGLQIAVLRNYGRSKALATAITELEFYANR